MINLEEFLEEMSQKRRPEIDFTMHKAAQQGQIPPSWINYLNDNDWSVSSLKEAYYEEKERMNAERNTTDSRSSGDKPDGGSDLPETECGRGHMADACPEGCSEGECEHPRAD